MKFNLIREIRINLTTHWTEHSSSAPAAATWHYGRLTLLKTGLPKITLQPNLPVEVLILDLHLPDMNGIELLHYLQTHPNTSTLPLIFCTAATENEVSQALSIAPGAWVVWKPFKLQELLSAINEALQTS